MKTFVQSGDLVEVTAPAGGVASGAGVLVGALFGVAAETAPAGAAVVLATRGVFDLPKATAAVFTAGGPVSWDAVNARCAAPGTGLYPVGVAVTPAGNGAGTVRVRLDGVATAAA
ncbi:DUF2190 family protein [Rhodospirillum centenum]|uniref:RecA/RadA family phage recombinase n=1 Tax=Rhodospirillum centenum (strain ATCC 51521 / SW) TaxID=414684 RepID=B6IMN3_RHOCS|nr:DUF2190 family protein [Rhodospirillum centenum]ACI98699.1 conserved hypothetical protein [Rhodospirillum centenum SW]